MRFCSLRYPFLVAILFQCSKFQLCTGYLQSLSSVMQVLGADLAILDEIDSGLDVDALRDVSNAVNKILTSKNSLLMITHYRRILDLLNPTHVHIMVTC